jgi:probable HAF family extracellular repeat protein
MSVTAASSSSTPATVISLGSFPGQVGLTPLWANAAGTCVGVAGSILSPETNMGYYWLGGQIGGLAPLSGGNASEGWRINDNGWIVGESSTASSASSGIPEAALWTGATAAAGTLGATDVGHLPGDIGSAATGVNDSQQVVGMSFTSGTSFRGFIWQNGHMSALGSLGGTEVEPYFINDLGQVVGTATLASGSSHAFLWQNGTMTDLGTLPGGSTSTAVDVNDSGMIVGGSTNASGYAQATTWRNSQISALPHLSGDLGGAANAVNSAGIVAGHSTSLFGSTTAVIWADGTVITLNSLLPANSGWFLSDATAITDHNVVFGIGTYASASAAYELTLPASITVSAATASGNYRSGLVYGPVSISDSSANISTYLDTLQQMAANATLGSVTLTDSGIGQLTMTAAQLAADAQALSQVSGSFTTKITDSAANTPVSGIASHGNLVVLPGNAGQYSFPSDDNGVGFTAVASGSSDHLNNVQALQFNDFTDIVAQVPGSTSVTTGNITELYAAVFSREPDLAGLAYYQAALAASPSTPLTQFAQYFLASPEYTGNSAHNYAQSAAGDTQFIDDLYSNLLHRAPDAGAVPYYLAVIQPYLTGLTPGTAAYANAETLAHAVVLTYFSQSAEFLSDVQVTAIQPSSSQHWLILI